MPLAAFRFDPPPLLPAGTGMTVLLTLLVGLALCALFFGTDSTERPRSPEEELAGLGYSWRDLDDPAEPSSHLPSPVKEHLA